MPEEPFLERQRGRLRRLGIRLYRRLRGANYAADGRAILDWKQVPDGTLRLQQGEPRFVTVDQQAQLGLGCLGLSFYPAALIASLLLFRVAAGWPGRMLLFAPIFLLLTFLLSRLIYRLFRIAVAVEEQIYNGR